MPTDLETAWPMIAAIASLAFGVAAAVHAVMTKSDVRAALGWAGVALLSPFLGAALYVVAGVNRIRRRSLLRKRLSGERAVERAASHLRRSPGRRHDPLGGRLPGIVTLGDRVTGTELTDGNEVTVLGEPDETYAAMAAAIDGAERTIWLESYIFDHDRIGLDIAGRLIAAQARGVEVRVLVDAVGARYTIPSIVGTLRAGGVTTKSFNGRIVTGLRLPYANMRTHRKLVIIDGVTALTGGTNITETFSRHVSGDEHDCDTHFLIEGPAVEDLAIVFAEDWLFASGEMLTLPDPVAPRADGVTLRVVASGPDAQLEANQRMILGALSAASRSVTIMTPYFIAEREMESALKIAALRGVAVTVIVPSRGIHRVVEWAMNATLEPLLAAGIRILRTHGPFNHSKLMVVDEAWVFAGSSNLDPRSLRLNFEVDLEIHDPGFAALVARRIETFARGASETDAKTLAARPFLVRLAERIVWLASPYL